jgi:hypothetical protein
MRFRDDIVRGVRLAGFAFAGLLIALAIHRTINFAGTADAKPTPTAPEPDPNAFLAMPAPVVPAPPETAPAPAPAPARPPVRPVAQKEQTVPPPPPPAPKRKESSEVAAKYVPRPVTPQTESLNAPAFIDPSIPHISAESLAAASEPTQAPTQAPGPPPGKLPEDASNAKLPPITPVFVVPPESQNKGHGMGWIKAVGRALRPKKDDQ